MSNLSPVSSCFGTTGCKPQFTAFASMSIFDLSSTLARCARFDVTVGHAVVEYYNKLLATPRNSTTSQLIARFCEPTFGICEAALLRTEGRLTKPYD